ncbi:MAG: response regulator [Bdellovibrio sp.]|nr:response regulator [Bdellovibrio sp.]
MTSLLLIDDDAEIRDLYGPFLRKRLFDQSLPRRQGDSLTICEDGTQALEVLQENYAFDIIICDYCMPVKNGGDVWNFVRKSYPNVPFILFTSEEFQELPEFDESFQDPRHICLKKPASPAKLLQVITNVLSESQKE